MPEAVSSAERTARRPRAPVTRPAWLRLPEQPMARHLVLGVLASAALFAVSMAVGSYNDYQLAQIGINAVAIAGLSVLVGTNGQISLGQGAFVMVGAYGAGLVLVHTKLPVALALVVAVAASGAFGVVIGVPASRLRGPYLAGMTLALAIGLPAVTIKYRGVFNGEEGLSINPLVPPGGVDPQRWLSWVVLASVVALLVLVANVLRSRFGRAFRAVRDDEVAAALVGISVARTQVLAFAVSSACAGLAGGLLGLATGIVNPGGFSIVLSISLLAGMVVGGTGSIVGAWWGAALLVYVPQWSSTIANHLGLQSGQSSNVALLFYGAVLVVVMLVAPSGIQGGLQRALAALSRRPAAASGSGRGAGVVAARQPVGATQVSSGLPEDELPGGSG